MASRVVIDTNVLVASLSSKSIYHPIIELILSGKIEVYVTDEILLEYEEILTEKYSTTVASNFINALKELPNVFFVRISYRWKLLKDEDDNKFSDCYVSSNAHYLITNDRGFQVLKQVKFPKFAVIKIEEFLSSYLENNFD